MTRADIGVIGGSGLYRFAQARERVRVETPHGDPSDEITIAGVAGRSVAFLPRHGRGHTIPPHRVNYRANAWALRELGCERVLGPCAVGSLRRELAPGDAVVPDGYVDRTHGRADTFFDGGEVAHLAAADPYCPELRGPALAAARAAGLVAHDGGVLVVVNGPRFSSRAESRWFRSAGWDLVGMTNYPEVVLARELGMCYATVCMVTDYDSGLDDDPGVAPVTQEDVLAVMERNTERLVATLTALIGTIPRERGCSCGDAPRPISH